MLRVILSFIIVFTFITPVMSQDGSGAVRELPHNAYENSPFEAENITDEIDMHSEVAEGGHGEGGLPQFETDTFASQIFWLAISFILLYFFFARSSLPKLSSTIEDRLTTIKTDLEQADHLSAEAEKTKNSYEDAMGEAHDNARGYIAGVMEALRKDAEHDTAAFKERTDREVHELETQASAAQARIKDDLASTAAELTQEIISKLAPLTVSHTDIREAVDHNLNEVTINRKTQKKAA